MGWGRGVAARRAARGSPSRLGRSPLLFDLQVGGKLHALRPRTVGSVDRRHQRQSLGAGIGSDGCRAGCPRVESARRALLMRVVGWVGRVRLVDKCFIRIGRIRIVDSLGNLCGKYVGFARCWNKVSQRQRDESSDLRFDGPAVTGFLESLFFSLRGARMVSVLFLLRMLAPPGGLMVPRPTWGTELTVSVSTVMDLDEAPSPLAVGRRPKTRGGGGALCSDVVGVFSSLL